MRWPQLLKIEQIYWAPTVCQPASITIIIWKGEDSPGSIRSPPGWGQHWRWLSKGSWARECLWSSSSPERLLSAGRGASEWGCAGFSPFSCYGASCISCYGRGSLTSFAVAQFGRLHCGAAGESVRKGEGRLHLRWLRSIRRGWVWMFWAKGAAEGWRLEEPSPGWQSTHRCPSDFTVLSLPPGPWGLRQHLNG